MTVNESYFDEASHRIWPVLVYQKVTSGDPDIIQAASSTQIKCLRDKTAENSGSGTETTSPTPSPTATDKPGTGVRLGINGGGWSVMMVALVCGLVMVD